LTVKGSFVGIGTQSPAINLHVVGGTDAKLNTGGFIVTGPITGANLAIDNNEIMARDNGSAAPLYLNTDGGNVNMCVYGGNVGIGTASPDYSLDVCGVIRAKEVLVSTGWCDYVFADDYRLPDLNEVEKFIKENGHLPEVTKGSEIESCGLDVGKISSQMIKKIEELTLYVIALDKKNQELQKEIDLLKK
jgi:hypothetical protein